MVKKAQFVGMELVDGSLVIVVDQGAEAVRFPLLALKEVHTKFKDDGRVTFMFATKQLFIAKAVPAELNTFLTALNEAVSLTLTLTLTLILNLTLNPNQVGAARTLNLTLTLTRWAPRARGARRPHRSARRPRCSSASSRSR